jgi:hypothetical protein
MYCIRCLIYLMLRVSGTTYVMEYISTEVRRGSKRVFAAIKKIMCS